MFYHVSKIGWFLVEPSNLLLAMAALGLVLSRAGFPRTGRTFTASGIVLLLFAGLSPLANWMILPLEMRFPVPDLTGKAPDGIIILGGAVQERQSLAHGPLALNDAGERVVAMADLARRFPKARVIFTGGAGVYSNAPMPEGDVVRLYLGALGLATDRVIIENKSVNTWENAVFTKEIIQPKPEETWLLVTSAWHMPRSVGIFRQVGWPVVAYPVDFRSAGSEDGMRGFSSVSDGLKRLEVASREWLGLAVYRMSGKSNALFPAP